MNFVELINLQIYEKLQKFKFALNFRLSLFFIISFNPSLIEKNIFDLYTVLNVLEDLSGKTPVIKKIFFKKSSADIKFIVQSNNVSKLFFLNFFLYLCIFNSVLFLKHLSIKLFSKQLNKNLLLKLQNFTVLSTFYGNLEKYMNFNVKYDLYATLFFDRKFFNNFYLPILLNL